MQGLVPPTDEFQSGWPDLAPPDEAEDAAGSLRGSIPPIGHAAPLPVLCDDRICAFEYIIGGGGAAGFDLLLCSQTLVDCAKAVTTTLSASAARNNPNKSRSREMNQKRKKWEPPVHIVDGASIRRASRKWESQCPELSPPVSSPVQTVGCTAPPLRDQLETLGGRGIDLAAFLNNERSSTGKLALHLAAWRGTIESCKLLLGAGASVDAISTGVGNFGKVRRKMHVDTG